MRFAWAGILYAVAHVWNGYLFPLGGFWGDWVVVGRWVFCIGDMFYLVAFAVLLSYPFRSRRRYVG
jgi:hypothetical protein